MLQALNDRGANLYRFKGCDAKTKNRREVSYRKAFIEEFLHTCHVRVWYKGALSKLGGHHVDRRDICCLNVIDVDAFADGDLLQEYPPLGGNLLDEK